MADEFFKFPHTPHLIWLGEGHPRGDKVLSPDEADRLLREPVILEEKVDGANVGISIDERGEHRPRQICEGARLARADVVKPVRRIVIHRQRQKIDRRFHGITHVNKIALLAAVFVILTI